MKTEQWVCLWNCMQHCQHSWIYHDSCDAQCPHWALRVHMQISNFHLCDDAKKIETITWIWPETPPSLCITQWFLGQPCDLSKSTRHEIWDHTGKPSGRCETARAAAACPWVAGVGKMPTGLVGCWWGQRAIWIICKDLKLGEMNPTSGRLNVLARSFRVAAANHDWTAHPFNGSWASTAFYFAQ